MEAACSVQGEMIGIVARGMRFGGGKRIYFEVWRWEEITYILGESFVGGLDMRVRE